MRYHFNIAVWAAVLYLIVTTTSILSFWQEDIIGDALYEQNFAQSNMIVSSIGIAVTLLLVHQLLKKKKTALRILRLSWPLVLVLIFSLISCLWSEVPFMAFRRFIKVLIMVICVLTLLSENDSGASLKRAIFIYITVTILISLVFILFFPAYGWMPYGERFLARGILGHKSGFSDFCAVSVLFVLWIKMSSTGVTKNKEVKLTLIGIIALFLLSLAQGINPSFNLFLALFAYFFGIMFNRIERNRTPAFLALSCSFISGIILLSLVWVNYIPDLPKIAVTSVGKDLTFTGRTQLWEALLYIGAKNHLFLGSGFASFFLGEKSSWLSSYLEYPAADAHSGYLKLFLELGIVGTIIFCFFLGHLAISIFTLKNIGYKEKSALQAMLLYAIFYNIISHSFLDMRISFLILITLSFYSAAIKSEIFGRGHRT